MVTLGPDALKNVLALVRPAGWIVIGVNNEHFEGKDFKANSIHWPMPRELPRQRYCASMFMKRAAHTLVTKRA
jgi:hypothetical protein